MSRKAKFMTEETLRILLDITSDGGSDLEEDSVANNDSNYKSDAESIEGSLSVSEYENKSTKNSSDNEPVPLTNRDSQPRKNFLKVLGVKGLMCLLYLLYSLLIVFFSHLDDSYNNQLILNGISSQNVILTEVIQRFIFSLVVCNLKKG